ncbi:type I secretion system permease/ATPase [Endozoicomonas sp. SESOKO4]|uniref:type I secretion system permease/ATPase n=1 Tax=Endozoicomonas sp. SESOKO4 TaxID=2828745 RepID=UPI0021475D6B|nr:type I secretion system permease/ATPase [Endozoicomonas sp. SESOKO4]
MADQNSNVVTDRWDTGSPEPTHFDALLDSLVIVTKLYDRPSTVTALSAGLPLIENKLTPALLPRAAERASLSARLLNRELDAILPEVLPAILLLHNGNACVLTKLDITANKATIIRPEAGFGMSEMDLDDLRVLYTGFSFFIKRDYKFDKDRRLMTGEAGKHWFWDTLRLSFPIYRDVLIASVVINLFVLSTPFYVRNIYDRVVPNSAFDTLWAFSIGIAIIFSFDLLLKLIRTFFLDVAGRKSDVILSSRIFAHVQALKLEHRPRSVGSFAKRVSEFESIRDFITSATLTTLVDIPFVIIFLIAIYIFSGYLAIVPVVSIFIILVITLLIRRPVDEAISHSYGASALKNGLLIETLNGLETVKSNRMEGLNQRKWEQNVGEASYWSNRSRLYSTFGTSTSGFIQQMTTVALLIVGVYEIANHDLTMGGLIAVSMLTGRVISPMTQVAGLIARWGQTKEAYNGIAGIMAMPVEREDEKQYLQCDLTEGHFQLENVSLTFPEHTVPVIKSVSINIPAGSRLAVIGRIGCGKTTLLRLLMGLYTPTEGVIKLDGIDIRQHDPSDLRKMTGCVEQQPTLFSGTIRDNIATGTPYATDAQILKAAEMAGVVEFTATHPEGLNRECGEQGRMLSGGQRQCVALARALLRDPKILIFDEPTSALDQDSERKLIQRLNRLAPDKTIIVFTQRLAILSLLDSIAVMDDGEILMKGTKQEILDQLAGEPPGQKRAV